MGMDNRQKKFRLPTGEDLKNLREQVGLSQAELARLASKHGENFSQPLIARIENATVNPPLSKDQILLDVLYAQGGSGEGITAGSIATNPVVTVHADDVVGEVIEIMGTKGISQIPVLDNQEAIVGSLSEKHLAELVTQSGREILDMQVWQVMEEQFPEVDREAPVAEVEEVMANNPAVIVKDGKEIAGILTKTNLLQYFRKMSFE